MDEKKQVVLESKDKEKEFYERNREFLMAQEINRLKNKGGYMVVKDFDCGPCARCKIKDKSVCNDGFNCKKRGGGV